MNKSKLIGAGLIFLVLICLLLAFCSNKNKTSTASYDGNGVIGVINIEGTILSSSGNIWQEGANSNDIMEQLRKAMDDSSIKAVVLRLNSPGGSATATQEIATEVLRLRESGKLVVASMGDMATSGAYWLAAVSDVVVANPSTLTGNIGVRMDVTDLQGLYEKLGVDVITFKSGAMKDMGSSNRPITEEEQVVFQGIINDLYMQFVDVVAEGRKLDKETVISLADGRIFTGDQALGAGLVDNLGNYYDALKIAGKASGLGENPEVISMYEENFWEGILSSKLESIFSLDSLFSTEKETSIWLTL